VLSLIALSSCECDSWHTLSNTFKEDVVALPNYTSFVYLSCAAPQAVHLFTLAWPLIAKTRGFDGFFLSSYSSSLELHSVEFFFFGFNIPSYSSELSEIISSTFIHFELPDIA
jgi:hypothetical protein